MTFLTILFLFKIVSLSSMVSALAAAIYVCSADNQTSDMVAIAAFAALIFIRHKANIRRILCGRENKIHWM